MNRLIASIVIASLAGCAIAPTARLDYSLIDPRGMDMAKYQTDYADCTALANQADAASRAAAGAVIGSLMGALLGAAICGRQCAEAGARGGAAGGIIGGADAGIRDQHITLRNCLTGRGYAVIR